jgi:hypothetical protein
MGLAERRAATALKEGDYKAFEGNIKQLCGFDVKMTFDWNALEGNSQCTDICENKRYNSYMFDAVTEAFQQVTADSMGKDALKSSLKEIVLIPAAGDLKFEGGVLTINNDLNGNGSYSASRIQETLESGL